MPRVFIPVQWLELTNGVGEVDVPGGSLRQVVAALDQRFPGLAARLADGYQLAGGVSAAIDGVIAPRTLLTEVAASAEIHFLPAIAGG